MFCKNCGAELNETSEFCRECGTKIGEQKADKKSPVGNRKHFYAMIVAVLALIVFFCVRNNSVNSSPEKVAAATLKSEYEADIKTMMKCFPEFTIREIAAEESLPADASRNEVANIVKRNYRYETPQKVKIIETELVKEYDISEYTIFRELYDYMTDDDYASITKVAKVNVRFTVDNEEDSIQMTCIKMKNKWYFLRGF